MRTVLHRSVGRMTGRQEALESKIAAMRQGASATSARSASKLSSRSASARAIGPAGTRQRRRCGGRRRRIGVTDRRPPIFQGPFTQTLWIALAGFRKLDDLSSECLTNRIDVVGGRTERRKCEQEFF